MSDDTCNDWFSALLSIICVLVLGIMIGLTAGNNYKKEAIQRGYAEYNPTNGIWQWKTNLVK